MKIKFFIICLLISMAFGIGAQADVLKVAVIHSYEKGTWTNEGTEGVIKALTQSGQKFEIKEEIYDYTKFKNTNDKNQKMKTVIDNLKLNKTALVILFDDEAADDLVPSLNQIKIPIVLTGINKDQSEIKWFMKEGDPKRFFTGILERYPFEQSLKMLKTIKPSVKKISILTSENETSRIVTGQIKDKFKYYKGAFSGIKLENTYFTSSWEKWKKVILNNNQDDRAFWILVPWNVNDDSGKEVDLRGMGDFYRENSKIPEIGIVNINDKLGFIASFSVGAEDLGFQAGQMALQIFKNKLIPRDTPFVSNSLVRFVINKKRADRLKITIPSAFLDFAKIEKKIPMDYFR